MPCLKKLSPYCGIKYTRLTIHPIGLPLAEEAFNVARQYGVTFYDASFLALARLLGCSLVTADAKLHRKARSFPKLKLLADL